MEHARREADARGAEGVQWRECDVQLESAALEGCVCLFNMSTSPTSLPFLSVTTLLLLHLLLKPKSTHRSLNTTPPLKLTPHTSVSQFTPPSPSTTSLHAKHIPNSPPRPQRKFPARTRAPSPPAPDAVFSSQLRSRARPGSSDRP